MKRLEQANRRAAYEAAGVPIPGKGCKEAKVLPPPPSEGPDHERLAHLAKQARDKNEMFYFFPTGGDHLKKDAAKLNEVMTEEEGKDETLRERRRQAPEKGFAEFLERLEDLQSKEREEQIRRGEVEDPWKRSVAPPAATSAGKPHEVVIENSELEENPVAKSLAAKLREAIREVEPAPLPKVTPISQESGRGA